MITVCSSASLPARTAWGTTSVNTSQVEPAGKSKRYFAHCRRNNGLAAVSGNQLGKLWGAAAFQR